MFLLIKGGYFSNIMKVLNESKKIGAFKLLLFFCEWLTLLGKSCWGQNWNPLACHQQFSSLSNQTFGQKHSASADLCRVAPIGLTKWIHLLALKEDRLTGITYQWTYKSFVHCTSARQSCPVIQRHTNSLTLLRVLHSSYPTNLKLNLRHNAMVAPKPCSC